jgi:hypothetical protein
MLVQIYILTHTRIIHILTILIQTTHILCTLIRIQTLNLKVAKMLRMIKKSIIITIKRKNITITTIITKEAN